MTELFNCILQIFLGVAVFACDSVGSLAVGIIFGLITALLTRVTHHVKRKNFTSPTY